MRKTLGLLVLVMLLALALSSVMAQDGSVPEVTRTQFEMPPDDMRNYRYCEILPVFRDDSNFTIEVYATISLNQCPDDLWEALDAETLSDAYGAVQVIMNGPRYWVVNGTVATGETAAGKTVDVGGIEMILRAIIETTNLGETVDGSLYTENEVQRNTTYTYLAGNMVYELISPEGDVYRMQSYSQIVDPNLTIDDLETLGDRLDLPEGWRYQARILTENSLLVADGLALVINDDFQNAYQKVTVDDAVVTSDTTSVELTDDICENPSNAAAIMGAMANSDDGDNEGPSFGETNIEQIMQMMQAPTEGPFYMVNLIQYREQAVYADGRETDLTGREANDLYSPTEFLTAIGARPVYIGDVTSDVTGEESTWDSVAIVQYPCPLAFFAMGADPEFQARSINKDAGLESSTVMVTYPRPLDDFELPDVASDDTAFELVQVVRYNDEAQYADGSNEPSRTGQDAMDFYSESILEVGLEYGVYPKARLEVEGVYIGDGQEWDEVWVYYAPSQEAFDAFLADPVVIAAQYHLEAALDDAYALIVDPMFSMIPN
ncbi:MAG: hypothetical protein AAF126_14490 [Chloroflexota bacterium]